MSARVKLQKQNILKTLINKITLRRRSGFGDYNSYIMCEYSLSRLTHDINDNHYYHNPDPNLLRNGYGIAEEFETKKRSR